MRRTLFLLLIIVPATVIISLLADGGNGLITPGPVLARKPPSESRATEAASRPRAVTLAEGAGTELFIESVADEVLDGKPVRYARSYVAAASYRNERPGVIVATDPMMVFNARPKSEPALARVLAIDPAGGSRRAMGDLAAAFGAHSGIRARSARVEGDVDLARVHRIEFDGDVLAILTDPEVPGDETRVETGKLVLEFDNRELIGISTDDAFAISRPRARDLAVTGRGLEVRLRDHKARLLHDIRIETVLGRKTEDDVDSQPFTLATPGPIDVELGSRPGKPRSLTVARSRATTAAGITFSQGERSGSADRATVVFDAASKIESLDLDGSVRLLSPDGEAQGSNLHLLPRDAAVFARLVGSPVTMRLDRRSSMLPARLGSNATLTTNGALVISPVRAGPDGRRGRSFEAGPGVLVTTTSATLEAGTATAWKAENPDADVSFRAAFETVAGRDEEDEFHAARVAVARENGRTGSADRITLYGPYDVLHRPKRPPADAAGGPESRRDLPRFDGDAVSIRGGGSLELLRPVLDDGPIVVDVREAFHMESLEAKAGKVKGTLDAEGGHAVLDFVAGPRLAKQVGEGASRPASRPSNPMIEKPYRELAEFSADRHVRVELIDRARARGAHLAYDGRLRKLTLAGGGDGEPAFVQRTVPGSHDSMTAGTIVFHQDILLVVGTGGVDADIAMPALPWVGDAKRPKGQTVATKVHAQRVTASLDSAKYAQGQIVPAEMTSEVAVKVTQPDHVLSCDYARFAAGLRSGSGRGSPLRYAVTRTVGGARLEEGVTCPSMSLDQRTLVLEGQVEGLFHAKPFLPGKSLRLGAPESGPVSQLQPLVLRCKHRAVLDEETIIADERVEMEQGAPPADGMKASSDEAIIFLEPKSPAGAGPAESKPGDREVGLVVLRGHATYVSRDFDAACDQMMMNEVTKHAHLANDTLSEFTILLHRQAHKSDVWNGVSLLDVDFTDPANPKVETHDHTIVVPPDSRRSGQ